MWVNDLIFAAWNVLRESAIFILVGFAIAGGLHVLLGRTNWARFLRGLGAKPVMLASAIGLPLPLCSCGVLPAAVSLRRQGASKGATISFLISTPETSIQSVLLTYALLGPVMAIYRPIAALVTALAAGLADNFAERRAVAAAADTEAAGSADAAEMHSCCREETKATAPEDHSCCHEDAEGSSQGATSSKPGWREGARFAFVDIFDDVFGWLILGVAVAAAIQVLVPGFIIHAVFGPPIQAMLVMLIIGVPLYVCAEASTPIAAALILQGVNPGAALVFLLAGPATNIGSLGLLIKEIGKRSVAIYLTSIAIVSVAMGLLLNWFMGDRMIRITSRAMAEPFLPVWLKTAGAVAFLVLMIASLARGRYFDRLAGWLDTKLPVGVTPARLLTVIVIILALCYAGSGLFAVQPGQVGIIKRFGRISGQPVMPGLHYHLPYPLGSVDRVDTQAIHRLVLGAASKTNSDSRTTEEALAEKSWVLLGDENIANIQCAVHWRMRSDALLRFAYAAKDHESLVSGAVRSAVREVLAGAQIDTVFTTAQRALANAIRENAQAVLDRCESGVELVAFDFLDLHAPAEVHDAFREVASALEERDTRRNKALTEQARLIPIARGTAEQTLREADGYKIQTGSDALGRAERFRSILAAYRAHPEVTRLRLILEAYDKVFPGLRKCIKPGQGNYLLDLRFGGANEKESARF